MSGICTRYNGMVCVYGMYVWYVYGILWDKGEKIGSKKETIMVRYGMCIWYKMVNVEGGQKGGRKMKRYVVCIY